MDRAIVEVWVTGFTGFSCFLSFVQLRHYSIIILSVYHSSGMALNSNARTLHLFGLIPCPSCETAPSHHYLYDQIPPHMSDRT